MTKLIHGFVLIDAWASALNNSGLAASERTENIVRTKIAWREGKPYPYISGQSWRYWWRSTLEQAKGWKLSPIFREAKIAFTAADPITYADDDIFGYMRAEKKATLTRHSPLRNSVLMSIGFQRPTEDFGTFSRFEGNPVPYEHEFYSTVMKGMFSVVVDDVGVFKKLQRAGSLNLSSDYKIPAGAKGIAEEKGDEVVLKKDERVKRISDVLSVLPYLDGGAMQTRHLTRVAPSLVVLGAYSTASHIFSHLAHAADGVAIFNTTALKQVLDDYEDMRLTKVYIGREEGFMDDLAPELTQLQQEMTGRLMVGSVRKSIDSFCGEIPKLVG